MGFRTPSGSAAPLTIYFYLTTLVLVDRASSLTELYGRIFLLIPQPWTCLGLHLAARDNIPFLVNL